MTINLWTQMIAAIIYGMLSLSGGIVGYMQAKSLPSLFAGVVSGLLLIAGGLLLFWGQDWGRWVAIATTAMLVVTFVFRLWKTRRFFPAGLMIITGIPTVMILLAGTSL